MTKPMDPIEQRIADLKSKNVARVAKKDEAAKFDLEVDRVSGGSLF